MFGSPLALVLAYRKISVVDEKNGMCLCTVCVMFYSLISLLSVKYFSCIIFSAPIPRPTVQQVYNLFHPTDPVAARIEPLLSARFSMLPPINIPRYQKYPLGNGQPYHLCKHIFS